MTQNREKRSLRRTSSSKANEEAALVSTDATISSRNASLPITPLSNEAEAIPQNIFQRRNVLNRDFLGPTSYSDVLTEGFGSFDQTSTGKSARHASEALNISAARLSEGCRALEFLANRSQVDELVKKWIEIDQVALSYPRPAMRIWLSELWATHGEVLGGRLVGPKRTLCETLWQNTNSSIPITEDTSLEEWSRCATGEGIRWEVIGLIAITYAFYIISPHASHHNLISRGVVQPAAVADLLLVSETCVSFCRDAGVVDDLSIWLLYEHWRLIRDATGNRSFRTYAALGDVVSASMSVGMHKARSRRGTPTKAPLFLVELRRRTFLSIYAHEISMALFLGRPNRVSSSYCDLEQPLDLTDDELALPAPLLAKVIKDLQGGEAPSRNLQYILWLRAWTRIGPRREEVLDLALGHHDQDSIIRCAAAIEQRMQQDWLSMPLSILSAVSSDRNMRQLSLVDALFTTILKIDFSTNDLLLQRIVLQRTAGTTPAKLISAAHKILDDIRHIAHSHQIAHTAQTDYIYILISGLSSAAILAVELLKQEQRGVYDGEEPLLSRSRTVQDLAEFVTMLKTIDPANAAYPMCEQSHLAISQILDKVLSHRPGEGRSATQNSAAGHDGREQTAAMDQIEENGVDEAGCLAFAEESGMDDPFSMPMTEDPEDWLTFLNTGAAGF
ncbi:hypothetical protein LIA77_08325 [Sarocladium implicatum]|nr:hypothetical protein LIA77_08325 [Sarocladium implicatum]